MSGPYDNPEEYISEEKRKQKMLKKAIEYMDKKDIGEDEKEMTPEEIVAAAEKFDEFVQEK